MAKYYGKIGFATQEKTAPGIWEEKIVEQPYSGDTIKRYLNNSSGNTINTEVTINNDFSIIADPYACKNFPFIVYVTYMGVKWEVTSVTPEYPRLILSVGGVYNESANKSRETSKDA